MKRALLLLVILLALVGYSVETFSQELDVTTALCALNREAPTVLKRLTVPLGAQHRKEIVWRKTVPEGFGAVLGLMQVVSVAPCPLEAGQEAKLAIRAIRLIERDPLNNTERIVSQVTDFADKSAPFRFDGMLYPRTPHWYSGGSTQPVGDMLVLDDKTLVIDLAQSPRTIYHGWTDPKVVAEPGKEYLVEMEVKIIGLARLQIGTDYWRTTTSAYNTFDSKCQKSNNCEGSLSRWFGPISGNDWQTVRVPEVTTK